MDTRTTTELAGPANFCREDSPSAASADGRFLLVTQRSDCGAGVYLVEPRRVEAAVAQVELVGHPPRAEVARLRRCDTRERFRPKPRRRPVPVRTLRPLPKVTRV
jgi:hypothetical protein